MLFRCERLIRQEEACGIRILECRGADTLAVIPEFICSLPVTELAPYLFSAHPDHNGREGAGTFWWDGMNGAETGMEGRDGIPAVRGERLEELRLPPCLSRVGAYAFYNCEKLQKLELYSTVSDWGAGVFTGCLGLRELTVHVDENRKSCLREILAELRQTLELTYIAEAGRESRLLRPAEPVPGGAAAVFRPERGPVLQTEDAPDDGHRARLIFPEFFEEAVENTPARILVTETHGCGQKYRNAFVRTQFQFREYDSLFPHVQVQEPEDLVSDLALLRLMYPYQLEERYEKRYLEYLTEHAAAAAAREIQTGWFCRLQWLFGHIVYSAQQIDGLLELAGKAGRQDMVSYLMDRRRGLGGVRRKHFSL